MSYTYKTIDISSAFDAQENSRFEHLLEYVSGKPDNHLAMDVLARAGVSKGVRENNLEMVQHYMLDVEDPEFTREVLQALARGYDSIFDFFTQHPNSFCVTSGLEAAAYYGRSQAVKTLIPLCMDSSGDWRILKGVDASIAGRNMHILSLLLPHANLKKHDSCALRAVLEKDDYEVAELIFPYINPSHAIKDIKEHGTLERAKPMITWIKHHLSDQKLKARLEHSVEHVAAAPVRKKM